MIDSAEQSEKKCAESRVQSHEPEVYRSNALPIECAGKMKTIYTSLPK